MNLNLKTILKSFFLSVLSFFLVAGVLYAATTIGSNITTAGTLAVTSTATFSGLVKTAVDYSIDTSAAGVMNIGTTTATTINIGGSQALTKILGNASTTMVSLSGALWVGGNATTTSAGAISTGGTLSVSGLTTLAAASSTNVSASGSLWVGGNATTTSAGQITTVGNISVATTTTTMTNEIAASSASATTTLHLGSSSATQGGCIQLEGPDNLMYRMYINRSNGVATTTAGSSAGAGLIAVWEAGSCK